MLFVHGVGSHSRLSSLLQAYQAFRSNIRSPEAPIGYEDPIPDWQLETFEEEGSAPYLKLTPIVAGKGETQAVYLYEVNYSALAGVLRTNQPLDITRLFVGLDLAVNVARRALRAHPPGEPPPGGYEVDHAALARSVQKLTGVLAAATVPILGIPSLVFRAYTKSLVATFTRFFSDIATFALDKNGEGLIAAHVDRTVRTILDTARFKEADAEFDRDVFAVAAHSLGTIVTHHYIVRHSVAPGCELPSRVLTFGSPIGLVCWMWLFLDFEAMRFDPANLSGAYFCWTPKPAPATPLPPLYWINVVNFMDPIATAFPLDYLNLDRTAAQNAASLVGHALHHRFIRTGGMFSAGSSHTDYFDDPDFLEIVGRLSGVRSGAPDAVAGGDREEHWEAMAAALGRLRAWLWIAGVAFVAAYVGVIARAYGTAWPFALAPLYVCAPLTIGSLAFFQRLFFGWPTKRTAEEGIETLPWRDWAAFPYRLRRALRLPEPDPLAAGPRWPGKLLMWAISFLPAAFAMLAPLYAGYWTSGEARGPFELVWQNRLASFSLLALFMAYFVLFATSEFAAHWRRALSLAIGRREAPRYDPSQGATP